jgi:6,7-dimethyl-8-ribityllumazine synthase
VNPLRIIEGDPRVGDLRIALVASRFNAPVVERLVAGAVEALAAQGADPASLELVRVPGAFDLPLVDTPHFDYVAGECAAGLARVASETGVPVAFGVLTTDTEEQAFERAGGSEGNRGADAARVAVELANLMRRLAR